MPPKTTTAIRKSKRMAEKQVDSNVNLASVVSDLSQTIKDMKSQITELAHNVQNLKESQQTEMETIQPIQLDGTSICNTEFSTVNNNAMSLRINNVYTSSDEEYRCFEKYQYLHTVPLGTAISEQIKSKIWNDEFVEMASLLPENPEKKKKKTIIIDNFHTPTLGIQENPQMVKSLDEWLSAFSIYSTIYIEKFQQSAAGLLK